MGCNLFSRRRGRGRGSRKFFKPIRSLRGKRYLKSTAKSRQFGGDHCTTHYTKGGSGVVRTIEDTTQEAVDEGEKLGKRGASGVGTLFSTAGQWATGIARSVRGSVRRNTGLGGGSRRGRRRRRKSRRRRRKGCGCK